MLPVIHKSSRVLRLNSIPVITTPYFVYPTLPTTRFTEMSSLTLLDRPNGPHNLVDHPDAPYSKYVSDGSILDDIRKLWIAKEHGGRSNQRDQIRKSKCTCLHSVATTYEAC
jgi:hypothetical protein